MACNCLDLELLHGQGDCKCIHYREQFPDCMCESESVSEYSPGRVSDDELLVRTLFTEVETEPDGYLTPKYFRSDPEKRGFCVDRLLPPISDLLMSNKSEDPRYNGYLRFIAARTKDVRELMKEGKRLFCVYDSGTEENRYHADICLNVYVERGAERRKPRLMGFARQLREVFGKPQLTPEDCYLEAG